MAVLKPRSRTVTFRVSSEEFLALTASCQNSDSRSISDFARAAVLHKIRAAGRGGLARTDMSTLGKALEELDAALGDVSKAIRSIPASDNPDNFEIEGKDRGAQQVGPEYLFS